MMELGKFGEASIIAAAPYDRETPGIMAVIVEGNKHVYAVGIIHWSERDAMLQSVSFHDNYSEAREAFNQLGEV